MRCRSPLPSTLLITALAGAVPIDAPGEAAPGAGPIRTAAANIYRCPDEGGIPLFSQFPCRASDGPAGALNLKPLQIVRITPLAAAERRRLDDLERERQRQRALRVKARQRADSETRRQQRDRKERCRAARAGLEALRDERRKGYTLRREPLLERREAELDARAQAAC